MIDWNGGYKGAVERPPLGDDAHRKAVRAARPAHTCTRLAGSCAGALCFAPFTSRNQSLHGKFVVGSWPLVCRATGCMCGMLRYCCQRLEAVGALWPLRCEL